MYYYLRILLDRKSMQSGGPRYCAFVLGKGRGEEVKEDSQWLKILVVFIFAVLRVVQSLSLSTKRTFIWKDRRDRQTDRQTDIVVYREVTLQKSYLPKFKKKTCF